ncbi:3-oxoacyl-ACP synthase III family protein [bacterium]|nr:3-oxoacyl-ACP synthase III family protein [bacterium]
MSSNNIEIIGIGSYLPEKKVDNHHFNYENYGVSDEWLVKAGVKYRHVAEKNETIIDLAYNAAINAISNAKIDISDIDAIYLVSGTISPEQIIPAAVLDLQKKLGITESLAFQTLDTCCGFLNTLELATHSIMAGSVKCALVIGAEVFSKAFCKKSEVTFKVSMCMGDGAGALILKASKDEGFISSYLKSSTKFSGGLKVCYTDHKDGGENGGLIVDFNIPENVKSSIDPEEALGRIIDFTKNAIPNAIKGVYEKTGFSHDNIDHFILHQPNRMFIESWKKLAMIPPEKHEDTLIENGNMATASIPVTLDIFYKEGKIKKGETLLFASVGEGATWGAMIWKWNID